MQGKYPPIMDIANFSDTILHNITAIVDVVDMTDNVTQLIATSGGGGNDDVATYRLVQRVCNNIILPWILFFGLLGNVLSITVLCQRRFHRSEDKIERCAAMGFLFLAVSDLLFCLVGLPAAFLRQRLVADTSSSLQVFELIYLAVKPGLVNLFLFTSTWCTVIIALERYLVVVHPLKARIFVRLRRTIIYQTSIIIGAVVFSVPHFIKPTFHVTDFDNSTYLTLGTSAAYRLPHFAQATTMLWNIFGAFVPILVLTFCYVNLLAAIYRSRRSGMIHLDKYVTSKITTILVSIMTLYFLLVCPSVFASIHAEYFSGGGGGGEHSARNYRLLNALVITNLLQAVNFAINFLLYFSMNPKFRKFFKRPLCRTSSAQRKSEQRYEVIHMRVK